MNRMIELEREVVELTGQVAGQKYRIGVLEEHNSKLFVENQSLKAQLQNVVPPVGLTVKAEQFLGVDRIDRNVWNALYDLAVRMRERAAKLATRETEARNWVAGFGEPSPDTPIWHQVLDLAENPVYKD